MNTRMRKKMGAAEGKVLRLQVVLSVPSPLMTLCDVMNERFVNMIQSEIHQGQTTNKSHYATELSGSVIVSSQLCDCSIINTHTHTPNTLLVASLKIDRQLQLSTFLIKRRLRYWKEW